MELIRITDLTAQLGLTSRSLRYYEEIGLIQSIRREENKYRYYDEDNIERLKQIMVLRKMMIPIKDILRIYDSDDMKVVVEVFVNRIHEIDKETAALAELKRITDEFLHIMQQNGVKSITTLPLLYEILVDQEFVQDGLEAEEDRPVSERDLAVASDVLAKQVEPSIVHLRAMRVLLSLLKENPELSDPEGFWHWVQQQGISSGEPGMHEQFEYQTDTSDVFMVKIGDEFKNDGKYLDSHFEGGLFAEANIYVDEDLGQCFRSLIAFFDENKYYEIDYVHGGGFRHPAMVESLISPDEKRELVSMFVPVKKRWAVPDLFGRPKELAPDAITVEAIEKANPILWTKIVPVDTLTKINDPYYRITEAGEAEYISWISTRVLSTNTAVRLPFRVDLEFRVGEDSGGYGHGSNESSIRFHHGGDLNDLFGINMDNNPDERLSQEAICFHQPVFGDYFSFPKRGGIKRDQYNRLTWIVGLRHFAVIINGELRYCGVHFPYMTANLVDQQAHPIILGSNGSIKKYFRRIEISQLAQIPVVKIRKGELVMVTKQSNNMIANIHRLITSEYGENYWFNGCARYVMEALGEFKEEPDFGYWFFAGLTGDIFTQVYHYKEYLGESVSASRFQEKGGSYIEDVFKRCGYAGTFVTESQLTSNKEMYVQTLTAYIDKGVPVLAVTDLGPPWVIYVGYEEYGKTLLFLTGDKPEPERISLEQAVAVKNPSGRSELGWFFIGEKKASIDLARTYRDMIASIPKLFNKKTEESCFGAEAFRAWAGDIEKGKWDQVDPEGFDAWAGHISAVCNMATNGSCASTLLERVQALNPDFTFLNEVRQLYWRTAQIWNDDDGTDLEALGAGFNVSLQRLQDKEQSMKIAAKLKEAAECMDRVMTLVQANVKN